MIFVRLFILVICACVDIRVRADSKSETKSACWGVRIPCQVFTSRTETLAAGKGRIILASGTLLDQRDEVSLHLIHGRVLVDTDGQELSLKSPFGRFLCSGDCVALLDRDQNRFQIRNLGGDWRVERLGDGQSYSVRTGTQVTLASVDESGRAHLEFPLSLPWLQTAKDWAELFPDDKKEFGRRLLEFRKVWSEAVNWVSDLHVQKAQRTIAQFQEELRRTRALAEAKAREDEDLKLLFRKKNYLAP